jgi:hypothetical protein
VWAPFVRDVEAAQLISTWWGGIRSSLFRQRGPRVLEAAAGYRMGQPSSMALSAARLRQNGFAYGPARREILAKAMR